MSQRTSHTLLSKPGTFSRRVATFFCLCLILAACGGSSTDDPVAASSGESSESADVSVEASSDGDAQAAPAAASDDEPRTLDDYLGNAALGGGGRGGGGGFGFGGDEDEALAQQRQIQQSIQACMQEQGFEYTPEEVGDGFQFFAAAQNQSEDPADYAATEGFGISTRFDQFLEADVEVEAAVNPNDEFVATLSEGEADAWNFALNGAPPERNDQGQLIDPDTGEVLQRGAARVSGGCQLAAQTQARGDAALLAELADDLELLFDRIDADPRITEIQREWIDCMSAQGFDYDDEAEARADINSQVQPLLRSFFGGANNAQQGNDDGGDNAQGGGGAAGGGGGRNPLQAIAGLELTAEQEVELGALQDLERAVAVASLECEGGTAEEVAEITAGYEADFVNENRAALEALSS